MSNKEICDAVLNSNLPNEIKVIIIQKFKDECIVNDYKSEGEIILG